MLARLRDERGMGMIEMLAAIMVITIALLALMASYDQAFFSLHQAGRKTAAANIAETQLQLYSALPYASVGLSSSLVTTAKASDAFYHTDELALTPAGTTEVYNLSCDTSSAQCKPVQTGVTGSDGLTYRVETFVRDVAGSGTATERDVTVIVRDPHLSGTPKVYTVTAAFDQGPRS